jgi:hypothetical protein
MVDFGKLFSREFSNGSEEVFRNRTWLPDPDPELSPPEPSMIIQIEVDKKKSLIYTTGI